MKIEPRVSSRRSSGTAGDALGGAAIAALIAAGVDGDTTAGTVCRPYGTERQHAVVKGG